MIDPSDYKGSEIVEMNKKKSSSSEEETHKKTCVDCGTSKTPLWRGGPAGPKSLCNACGIRSRKKRRALLGGAAKKEADKKAKRGNNNITSNGSNNNNNNNRLGDSLKERLYALGREVLMQRSTSVHKQKKKNNNKLGEEEQAAVLLMALSYGSVYA